LWVGATLMPLQTADIYERTLYWGEPIRQPATPTRLARPVLPAVIKVVQEGLWFLGDWAIRLPKSIALPAPDAQRMMRELEDWTDWSSHKLARLLNTTHTTIGAVKSGRPLVAGHSGDLRRRLAESHAVVSRIFLLCDRDPTRTA